MDYKSSVQNAALQIKSRLGVDEFSNYQMVILGSGFKGYKDELKPESTIDLAEIEGVPVPRVEGHGAELIHTLSPSPALVFTGRVHLYEGYNANDVSFTVRVCHELGIRKLILTNASGSVNAKIPAGAIVCVNDHINLSGQSSIAGPTPYGGERFVDMVGCYDRKWVAEIREQLNLSPAVYMQVSGPAYETPAETNAFRIMGADLVGMSTVQETLAARQLGMRVACLSLVTNQAGGLAEAVDHTEVLKAGDDKKGELAKTLSEVLKITSQ